MAATGTGAAEPRHHEKSGTPIVVVDLDEPQPTRLVRRLRKGQGKLMTRVERIVADLVEVGTVKSTAQPVVIVMRETSLPFWSFEEED
ncbi:MAG: hypothetical protein QOI93_5813 [Rhodospirillaceae bacterium]|jgi:hypothetical protein|nr:hypothetical protein [Rhodospirillaceae bacterium]